MISLHSTNFSAVCLAHFSVLGLWWQRKQRPCPFGTDIKVREAITQLTKRLYIPSVISVAGDKRTEEGNRDWHV